MQAEAEVAWVHSKRYPFTRSPSAVVAERIRVEDLIRRNPTESVVLFGFSRRGYLANELARDLLTHGVEMPDGSNIIPNYREAIRSVMGR